MSLALAAALAASTQQSPTPSPHPVMELRQYKIVPGGRERFIELFEREFVETQETEGMELIGQFRDRSDPDRFTWMRAFPSMEARQKSLTAFYTGPVWQEHRGAANPMLVDNDNVLLLRPVLVPPLPVGAPRPKPGVAAKYGLVVVTIHYLWKVPEEGFSAFFEKRLMSALQRAGLPVLLALIREESPNNFPRLPVREGEKLFVWVTRVDSETAWKAAVARLKKDREWPSIRGALHDLEERPAQQLLLDPTPRSRLR